MLVWWRQSCTHQPGRCGEKCWPMSAQSPQPVSLLSAEWSDPWVSHLTSNVPIKLSFSSWAPPGSPDWRVRRRPGQPRSYDLLRERLTDSCWFSLSWGQLRKQILTGGFAYNKLLRCTDRIRGWTKHVGSKGVNTLYSVSNILCFFFHSRSSPTPFSVFHPHHPPPPQSSVQTGKSLLQLFRSF